MSRYAARDSIGRVCADIEPMGVSPSGECGEDRSLDPYSHPMLNEQAARSMRFMALTRSEQIYPSYQTRAAEERARRGVS